MTLPADTTPAPVREQPAHVDGSPTAPLTPAVEARGRRAAVRRRSGEQPVFAARDGRRARRLRIVAVAAVGLVALWLVALVAGILGFGRLPVVPDLRPSTAAPKAVPHWRTPASAPSAAASRPALARSRPGRAARAATRGTSTRSRRAARRRTAGAHRRTPASTRRTSGRAPASGAPITTNGRRVGQTGIAPPTSSRPATPPGQQRKATLTTTHSTVSPGQGATHRAHATG